jgi:hypothetical protein
MIARIRRLSLAALTAVGVLALPAGAQQTLSSSDPAVGTSRSQAAPAGPTVERGAVGARPLSQSHASLDAAEAAVQQRLGLGQARALMIVGFSAVVIGLIIGDDAGALVAIGGAAIGLYGLYHYLR